MLIRDWFSRLPYLSDFYTEDGILPLSANLPATSGQYHFSIFDHLQNLPSVQFAFFVGLLGYLGLLLGYKTRLSMIVSFIFLTSMLNRNPLILSNSHLVLVTMLLWTLFLPMGKRFALDCKTHWRKSQDNKVATTDILSKPSLAAFAIVSQIALTYFLSAVVKYGESWQDGTAIFLSLQLDQFVTPLGRYVAQLPLGWLSIITFCTLALEWSAPLLILSPLAQPLLRRLAIVALTAMHLGIMLTMNVGDFSPIMVATYALLLRPRDWQDLKSLRGHFAKSTSTESAQSGSVLNEPTSTESVLNGSTQNEAAQTEAAQKTDNTPNSPARARSNNRGARVIAILSTIAALAVGSSIWTSAYNINVAPRFGWRKIPVRQWQKCLLKVAHIHQDWHIFAPNPPINDGWMVVDCFKDDRTHIDPLAGSPPTIAKPDNLQAHLPLPWRKYHNRIKRKSHRKYRQYYCRYLMAKAGTTTATTTDAARLDAADPGAARPSAAHPDAARPNAARPIGIRLYYCQEITRPPGMNQNAPIKPISIWYTPKEMKKVRLFGKPKHHRRVYFLKIPQM